MAEVFADILNSVAAVSHPIDQLKACDQVYELASDLIVATGSNGLRGDAAKEAVKRFGVEAVVDATGYTRATVKKLAGR